MGIQKKLRMAAKTNYALRTGKYLSGSKIGAGMRRAAARLKAERTAREQREADWLKEKALAGVQAAIDAVKEFGAVAQALRPKRTRKKATEGVVETPAAEKPKRTRKKPVEVVS